MTYVLPFAAYNIFTATYFQSIGHNKKAVFLTGGGRILLFMIPLAAILPNIFGVNGIYLIIPFSEIGTFFISLGVRIYHSKHLERYFTL